MRVVRDEPRAVYGTVLIHVLVAEEGPEMASALVGGLREELRDVSLRKTAEARCNFAGNHHRQESKLIQSLVNRDTPSLAWFILFQKERADKHNC
jgi:hypothetical protein